MRPKLGPSLRAAWVVSLYIGAASTLARLVPSIGFTQAVTKFGSDSGVPCPNGNVICNGSLNFLTTELFFEPETPPQGLKDTLVTWNEVEYLLDNPYVTGGGGNDAVIGGACPDGSGPQPGDEEGFPPYSPPKHSVSSTNIRHPPLCAAH